MEITGSGGFQCSAEGGWRLFRVDEQRGIFCGKLRIYRQPLLVNDEKDYIYRL
jgi:hypothetical protein